MSKTQSVENRNLFLIKYFKHTEKQRELTLTEPHIPPTELKQTLPFSHIFHVTWDFFLRKTRTYVPSDIGSFISPLPGVSFPAEGVLHLETRLFLPRSFYACAAVIKTLSLLCILPICTSRGSCPVAGFLCPPCFREVYSRRRGAAGHLRCWPRSAQRVSGLPISWRRN